MQRVLSFPPPARGFGDPSEFVSKRMCFSFMFSLGFLAFLGGFLLGRFVFDQELELSRSKLKKAHLHHQQVFGTFKNYSQFNVTSILDDISESSLLDHQRILNDEPATKPPSKALREAKILHDHLSSNEFDLVSPLVESQIYLSYPSSKHPNRAFILDESGNVVHQIVDTRPKHSENVSENSPVTSVTEGQVIYVNFGRNEDYHYLDSMGVTASGNLILVRAGGIPILDVVTNALDHDALGILIYLDPQQKGIRVPLLTPNDLAKVQIIRGNIIDKWSGKVPLLEIKFEDAEIMFNYMSATESSAESWRGRLKCAYPIGPGFSNPKWKLKMEVNTINTNKTSFDVLGAMRGTQEPDRFVMLANENSDRREQSQATSILMEVARVLGNLKKKGWRPHRSIVIAFWGPEGPNQHFMSHPETIWSHLVANTVIYLKVDSIDYDLGGGDQRLRTIATPIVEKLIYKSAETASIGQPHLDVMMPSSPDNIFIQNGVPFVTVNGFKSLGNSSSLKEITSFWSVATWTTAESHGLPFGLKSYENFFTHSTNVVEKRFKTIAQKHTLFLDTLFKSVEDLLETIRSFEAKWSHADKSKSIEMRIMNDQLLEFVHSINCNQEHESNVYFPSSGHLIFSKSFTGNDEKAGLGVLQDLLREITSSKVQEDLHRQIITHLARLVECINFAKYALTESLEKLIARKP